MLKQVILTAVGLISMVSVAQAQLYSTTTTNYPTTTESGTSPIQFDSKARVLTIEGTPGPDDCAIKTYYYYMLVELTDADGQVFSEVFDPNEVAKIVFNGGDGDDSFQFPYLDYMRSLRQNYKLYDSLECELNGGEGADILCGALGDDILNGGTDGEQDILVGNDGADLFVRGGEYKWSYNWYTGNYSRQWVNDYDSLEDYNSSEGDTYIWEMYLEENQLSSEKTSQTESSTSTTTTTTYLLKY